MDMYVRQPNTNAQSTSRVKIPDNYGGNAFSSSYFGDMPPPVRQVAPPKNDGINKTVPPLDATPKSSPLAEKLRNPSNADVEDVSDRVFFDAYQKSGDGALHAQSDQQQSTGDQAAKPHDQSSHTPSLLSALIPKGSISGNFPFGHGIGSEELLILGIMLLVYLSGSDRGEIDGEFIVLLGLLLFAG